MAGEWNGALLYIDEFGVILTCRVYPLSGYLLRPPQHSSVFLSHHSLSATHVEPHPALSFTRREQARPDRTIHCTLSSRPVPSSHPSALPFPSPTSLLSPRHLPALPYLPCLSPSAPTHLHSHTTFTSNQREQRSKQEQAGPPSMHPAILVIPSPIPSHPISCPVRPIIHLSDL